MKKVRFAYTLAEIMVAMAIIGVVFALTMPSVVRNYQDRVLKAQHSKSMEIIKDAIKLICVKNNKTNLASTDLIACYNKALNGQPECFQEEIKKAFKVKEDSISNQEMLNKLKDIDYVSYVYSSFLIPSAYGVESGKEPIVVVPPLTPEGDDLIEVEEGDGGGTYSPGVNIEPVIENNSEQINVSRVWRGVLYAFLTDDGIIYGIENPVIVGGRNVGLYIVVDTNGSKKPNKIGKDLHKYAVAGINSVTDITQDND